MEFTPRKKRRGPGRPKIAEDWEPSVRDMDVYRLVCEGRLTQTEIGERFGGLDRSTVSKIATKIDRWLVPQLMERIRALKARHTQHLLVIFREAMSAWDRSKTDEVTVTHKTRVNDTETTTRSRGQFGNPAFLAEARATLSDIRRIWGADAPMQVHQGNEVRVAGRPHVAVAAELLDRLDTAKARIVNLLEPGKGK